ncbi:MAG: DNA polymerase III subunit delta' [Sporichthyaceae bacterium]
MSVWKALVGQSHAVGVLSAAAASAAARLDGSSTGNDAMTHAWLITGPPGSGRSTAARAFAAALQCRSLGCGECAECHTVTRGTHADVKVVATDQLSIGVLEIRRLVLTAALSPAGGRWQIVVVEDADRLSESAANALLKSVEEPSSRTVWVLCAPSAEDVLATIRSRCRSLHLVTPAVADVADLLRSEGVPDGLATLAAAASQGHIGRARRLANDSVARERRAAVLDVPTRLRNVPGALAAADKLLSTVKADVSAAAEAINAAETEQVRAALGLGGPRDKQPPGAAAALKELEKKQKARTTRAQRDGLDIALVDLVAFYRDVLARQLGAVVAPVHPDRAEAVEELAAAGTPELTLRRIEAVLAAREALGAAAHPLLTIETMNLALR